MPATAARVAAAAQCSATKNEIRFPRPIRDRDVTASKQRILRYQLPGEWTVLAGRTDADNDHLSTALALPDDWWFHAHDVPGSHVILRAKPDADPSRETLRQAAAVAAYHSKARAAGTVRVYSTRTRYVTKPRGAKIGTVHVARGSILKVTPDISFAKRTLWREPRPSDPV
jgi:predicted ribosome quality control (RQC) complex YloA/Tae2 family protein